MKLLTTDGHKITATPEESDLAILFSCCVIETTELKMLRRAKTFSDLGLPMVVSGCMAVVQRDEFDKVHDNVYYLKSSEISDINVLIDRISEKLQTSKLYSDEYQPAFSSNGHEQLTVALDLGDAGGNLESKPGTSIDSIIPIATGCKGECTYCITRLARGDLKSYPENQIVQNITGSIGLGHYEVRLSAQDTACYGLDNNSNLSKLLSRLIKIETLYDFRVRVGMMNPDSVMPILDDVIDCYKHPRIFSFLHLPVQSGDDEILKAMGRKYTTAQFSDIVDRFRKAVPKLTLSTDIIIGYPNETDEQFEHSMELMKLIKPNIINITRFSARPGTPAAKLDNRLSGSTVKSRSRAMTELRFNISKELNDAEINNHYKVLITERVKPSSVMGRTDSYQPVVIKKELELGSWTKVKVIEAMDSYLVGEAR
jgi:MiaB-like tRNA modifying enzyme